MFCAYQAAASVNVLWPGKYISRSATHKPDQTVQVRENVVKTSTPESRCITATGALHGIARRLKQHATHVHVLDMNHHDDHRYLLQSLLLLY